MECHQEDWQIDGSAPVLWGRAWPAGSFWDLQAKAPSHCQFPVDHLPLITSGAKLKNAPVTAQKPQCWDGWCLWSKLWIEHIPLEQDTWLSWSHWVWPVGRVTGNLAGHCSLCWCQLYSVPSRFCHCALAGLFRSSPRGKHWWNTPDNESCWRRRVKWIPWGTLEGRQVLWLMAKSEEGTSREALMAPKEQLCNLVHENVNSQPSLQLMATMWTAKLPSQSTQYLPPRAPSCLISLQIWIKAGPERLPSPKFQTH